MGSDVGIVIILLQTSDSRSTAAVLLLVRGLEHWRVFLSLPAPPLAFGTHLAMGSAWEVSFSMLLIFLPEVVCCCSWWGAG